MLIEFGFGLCAAYLPSLYSLMATKGLQTLTRGFKSIYSAGSRDNSCGSGNKHQRIGSQGSDVDAMVHAAADNSNIEFGQMKEGSGITVMKRWKTAHSMA